MISGYMLISPGEPHTLPVGFLALCSRLPGCAGCTSSSTCSVWWCASDGLAPQTGWGPLSAPHPRKTSSMLWSSEFWQPLPCVPLSSWPEQRTCIPWVWSMQREVCHRCPERQWLSFWLRSEAHHHQQERGSGDRETKDNPHTTPH